MKNTRLLMLFVIAGSLLFCLRSAQAASYTVNMYYYNPTTGLLFYFSPTNLTVAKGDSVTWTNADNPAIPYSHTSTSGTNPISSTLWDSGIRTNGQTFTLNTANITAGTYPYFCTVDYLYNMTGTLIITNPPNVPPSVSITNPVAGAKFKAPANITLMVSASDTDGSVTNVQFFSGASSLGNVTNAPYNFTVNNVAAGNYSFTAKALDNLGAAATSAVVNVFVLTNATLTSPVRLTNGQFRFTILGISGQTYATEASTNLLNWSAISTNVAPASSFGVTDATSTNILLRFYRARQDLF